MGIQVEKSIEADAAGTFLSGFAGVTSTTPFNRKCSGSRSRRTNRFNCGGHCVTFLFTTFCIAFFKAIPPFTIYPVIVLVGTMMFSELRAINYDDPAMQYSTFFTVLGMPMTYSITDGLMLGALVYVAAKVMDGKIKETSKGMLALAAISILLFFFL